MIYAVPLSNMAKYYGDIKDSNCFLERGFKKSLDEPETGKKYQPISSKSTCSNNFGFFIHASYT